MSQPEVLRWSEGNGYPHSNCCDESIPEEHCNGPSLGRQSSRLATYQLYKIRHERCHKLEVTILQGRGITRGKIKDWLYKPNPFVSLHVKGTPNGHKKTNPICKNSEPSWNETCSFFVDPIKDTLIEFILFDLNRTVNEEIGRKTIDISGIPMGKEENLTVLFKNGSAVDVTLKLSKNVDPSLRFDLRLCDEELQFLHFRRQKVFDSLNKLLGEELNLQIDEVPNICIMTSGGGFRAMIACAGTYKALESLGLIDCSTYVAALSGSSWYTSTLYSHPDFPNPGVTDKILPELRECVEKHWQVHLSPPWSSRYLKKIIRKSVNGQPVSFTDFFGYLVGQQLLKSRMKAKLSDQQEKILCGRAPMPMYTCLHVKSNVSAKIFQEWYEFTPYEVGVPKYGVFMKSSEFASKFYMGQVVKKFPEVPLHFLGGIWGSAFTILFKRLVQERGRNGNGEVMKLILNESYGVGDQCSSEEEADDDDDENKENRESVISELTKNLISDEEDDEDRRVEASSPDPENSLMLKDEYYQGRYKPFCVSTSDDELNAREESELNKIDKTNENSNSSCSFKDKLFRKYSLCKLSNTNKKSQISRSATTQNFRSGSNSYSIEDDAVPSYFNRVLEKALTTTPIDSRAFRAGVILNPFRGLTASENECEKCIKTAYNARDPYDEDFKDYRESMKTDEKKIYLVDSGLSFNLPFPLTLRPQRGIQLYLTFDFSSRKSDSTSPFRELLMAEKWAQLHRQPFPQIKETVKAFIDKPNKECYVFKDTERLDVPVIIFFPLINDDFQKYSSPGNLRKTEEEKAFGNFKIFDDTNAYAIWRFVYPNLSFDRMTAMMDFNVKNNLHVIKSEIADLIERRRRIRENI